MQLVLLRHGQSTWNLENRFTGWVDIDLSEQGIAEAKSAAKWLKDTGWTCDVVITSVLKRAIRSAWIMLDERDSMWVPIICAWQWNERHYGDLQGKNKKEMLAQYGQAQVQLWRRSFDVRPPALPSPEIAPDARYQGLQEIPRTESLKDTYARVIPHYTSVVVPMLKAGQRVLICAHGNSLRALVKYLDHISDADIADLNIPTGIPLIYDLDPQTLAPRGHRYLGDPNTIAKAVEEVSRQTKR